jgi:6-pyruvoyltetrahydropterin/6-carboxytetrahydropterin synthase
MQQTTTRITKVFTFEAVHRLPNLPPGHKCGRLHGHSFKVEVSVSGKVDPYIDWVVDFADVKEVCTPFIGRLDHHYLNEIKGLDNPTGKVIAHFPGLARIAVHETCTCFAEVLR